MMENEKCEETNRPVTGWDKVHALALCVLAVVGIVMFVGPYIQWLIPRREAPPAPQKVVEPQMISTYGLPPLQMVVGKPVACAAPATYEDIAHAFVCVCDGPKRPRISRNDFACDIDRCRLCIGKIINLQPKSITRLNERIVYFIGNQLS